MHDADITNRFITFITPRWVAAGFYSNNKVSSRASLDLLTQLTQLTLLMLPPSPKLTCY